MGQAHKLRDYFIGSMIEDDVIMSERMKSREDVDEGSHHKQAESISSSLVEFYDSCTQLVDTHEVC